MPEVVMPRLSDTMEEGTLSRWLKDVGDPVHKGDVLAEIETDKATMDLEAFEDGVLERQLVAAGTSVPIGQPVAVIGDGSATAGPAPAEPASAVKPPAPEPPEAPPTALGTVAVHASALPSGAAELRTSPLARKLAHDHHLDLAAIGGSGPQGRITRADVEDAIAQRKAARAAADGSAQAPASQPSTGAAPMFAGDGDE